MTDTRQFSCDVCGQPIEHWELAALESERDNLGLIADFRIVHDRDVECCKDCEVWVPLDIMADRRRMMPMLQALFTKLHHGPEGWAAFHKLVQRLRSDLPADQLQAYRQLLGLPLPGKGLIWPFPLDEPPGLDHPGHEPLLPN